MSTLSLEKKYAVTASAADKAVRRRIPGKVKPYLFLLPAMGLILFWTYKPLLQTLQYSLYKWSMVPGTVPEFVGIDNFMKLFRNKDFIPALKNTLIYILGMLPFSIVLPLFIAAATQDLNEKAKKIYRAVFFIPMIMAPVAVSIIFQWLLHPGNGFVNHLLQTLGLTGESIAFFADQKFARLMIILISGWKMIGFSTLMFSSALSGIDTQYYEAAKLDGAGSIRRFFDMTLVLLSPTAMLMLMVSVLFSSQWSFAYIDVLTQGGPFATSTNIYYMMYKFAFGDLNVGLCAAAATLFLIVFGIIALTMQRLTKKYAFYDN
ncbi:MAG: sugar ABC transporter permease [Clostridiales bacterium]|nr:sugar ABC transporter permease [Clostridiales bacterium]MDU3238943.1 sugar ABC transporter permease [Clostridiales bacterium]